MVDYRGTEKTIDYKISEADRFRLDDFELYNLAREFRQKVYVIINQLPPKERYVLESQMRDAIVSVTNNIDEAQCRWHFKESIQFRRIARGSTGEIIDDLNICIDENYYDINECEAIKQNGFEVIRKTNGYIAYLNNQITKFSNK